MLEKFDSGYDGIETSHDGMFFCIDHVEEVILSEISRIEDEIKAEETELTRNILNGQASTLKKLLVLLIGVENDA